MSFVYLVWRNLLRRKLRTALTVLSIGVAFLLFGFLGILKQALVGGVNLAGADRLVVRHKVSIIQTLPQKYGAEIERLPGVVAAVYQSWFGGIYQDPNNFFPSMPVEPEPFLAMFDEVKLEPEQKAAWMRSRTGLIAGRATANRFGWKIGDRIALKSPIWPKADETAWEFDLVGIYDNAKQGGDTARVFFRHDYFEEARQYGKGEVGWFTVRVRDPQQAPAVAKAIDEQFVNSPAETKTEGEGAFVQGFAKQIGDIGLIITAILSAVFFTILLVSGNTIAQSVRERTEEIGVLKALGFSDRLVFGIVLGESCVISAVGGFGGLLFAVVISLLPLPIRNYFPTWYLPVSDLLIGVLLVAGLGLCTGILPAWQATRLQIATALRRGN